MKLKKYVFLLLPVLVSFYFQPKLNNSCKNHWSYFYMFFSSDCYHTSDLNDDILKIIHRYVGVSETHQVHTEDGYILTVFRIPKTNPKGVILLQHAINTDAQLWTSQYNNSVAFFFWRAGYDVWLGNSRGTLYSRHSVLNRTDKTFWNFTFHEIGFYDNHATAEYILKKTNTDKIIYLGFSLGATSGLVYASTRPQEASRFIKTMVAMTPATHFNRSTSPVRYFVPLFFYLQRFINLETPILKGNSWMVTVLKTLLYMFPCKKCLVYVSALIMGWSEDEIQPELMNMIVKSIKPEISVKTWNHFNQIYFSQCGFQMYDYGEKNMLIYGKRKPPLYPLEDIKIPILLVYGQNDILTCIEDNEMLYGLLPENSKIHGKVKVEGFSHLDVVWSRHRDEKVYKKILHLLEKN